MILEPINPRTGHHLECICSLCTRDGDGPLLGMDFRRIYLPLHTDAELRAAVIRTGLGSNVDAAVASLMAHERRCEHYRNPQFHAVIDRESEHGMGDEITVWHVSFKRHDRRPMHDWRKVQQIKTALLGADVEAVEIYPAESRVVDTANQYHLWAFPGQRLPFGFPGGLRLDNPMFGNAVQRPGERRMTTKHTHPVVFGRRVAGCPRCAELDAGAAPIKWAPRRADRDHQRCLEIKAHFESEKHRNGGCGPVCTFGDP